MTNKMQCTSCARFKTVRKRISKLTGQLWRKVACRKCGSTKVSHAV